MEAKNFTVLTSRSYIYWTGRKARGIHSGTIPIKEGNFTVISGKLEAAKIIVDSTSVMIEAMPDSITNDISAAQIASHNFFSFEKFPTAIFEFISAFPKANLIHHIECALTIRGVTEPVSFDAHINISGDTLMARCKVAIDCKKYKMGLRWSNFFKGLSDPLIYNKLHIEVSIIAKAG
jgi:polyisoprenoid-binding protein YceI